MIARLVFARVAARYCYGGLACCYAFRIICGCPAFAAAVEFLACKVLVSACSPPSRCCCAFAKRLIVMFAKVPFFIFTQKRRRKPLSCFLKICRFSTCQCQCLLAQFVVIVVIVILQRMATLILALFVLCANSQPQFTHTTATLSTARSNLPGVSVGSKALFAGGQTPTTYLPSVDVYDVNTKTWSVLSLSQPRAALSAVAVRVILTQFCRAAMTARPRTRQSMSTTPTRAHFRCLRIT